MQKMLMVSQLEAARDQAAFYQRMTSLFGPLKNFLCTFPKASGVEGKDKDNHQYCHQ